MFVAVYWWRVHPGKEEQFRKAWHRETELITQIYASYGSRLLSLNNEGSSARSRRERRPNRQRRCLKRADLRSIWSRRSATRARAQPLLAHHPLLPLRYPRTNESRSALSRPAVSYCL